MKILHHLFTFTLLDTDTDPDTDIDNCRERSTVSQSRQLLHLQKMITPEGNLEDSISKVSLHFGIKEKKITVLSHI